VEAERILRPRLCVGLYNIGLDTPQVENAAKVLGSESSLNLNLDLNLL